MDKPKKKYRTRKKRLDIDTVSKSSSSTATTSNNENKEKEKAHTTTDATQDGKSPERGDTQETSGSPRGSGASSPEPNCAICLGRLENRSFTDSCFHTFCFVCLVEWSKVKAECPLCKQTFKSIYHNVRSNDDYDQYPVRRQEEPSPACQIRHLVEGARFRYRTTVTDHRYATGVAAQLDREIQSRLLQRPSRRFPIPNWRRIRQPANSDFRRSVYLQRLKQRAEQINTRRRVRETSPSFFRENTAQTHRLVPWLNRELNALMHGHGEQIAFVLDLIMGLIKRHSIDSEEFYQHVYPYIGPHTRQFMSEFMLFAKSPYHMAAYDRHVNYEAGRERHHDSESDSDHNAPAGVDADDGNDSDVVVVSPDTSPEARINPAAAPPRSDSNLDPWERSIMTVGNPSYLGFPPIVRSFGTDNLSLGFDGFMGSRARLDLPTSASGWDSPTPGTSSIFDNMGLIPLQCIQPDINPAPGTSSSIWNPLSSIYSAPITPTQTQTEAADNMLDPLNLQPVTSNSHRDPIVCNETDSESDSNSDEVMIVDYEKPWNERSPIQLSSACEDTDSDIVITGMSYADDCVKKEKKKKKKHKKKDSRDKEKELEQSRKRNVEQEDTLENRNKKRRRHSERSRGRATQMLMRQDRSRSRSQSPFRFKINLPQSKSPSPVRISCRPPKSRSPTLRIPYVPPKSPSPIRLTYTIPKPRSPIRSPGARSKSRSPMRISMLPSYSPIRMRLYKPPDYSHKKFGYRTESRDSSKKDGRHHSRRSHSSSCSRQSHQLSHRSSSGSPTDSDPDSDTRHVSYTSHKHRNASIKILEYHKKSSKHKKNKKHKKDKKKGDKKNNLKHSKSKERTEILDLDLTGHKKKHSKSKKKKSKQKTHKDRPHRQSEDDGNKEHDSSSEQTHNADSDERGFSQDVSRQVARIFKEIAEIKQQTGQEKGAFTSDSEADSDVNIEEGHDPHDECSSDDTASENTDSKGKSVQDENETTLIENPKLLENPNTETLNPQVIAASEIEFVELPLDQTASVDIELANIAKSLDNSAASVIENLPGHRMFKKHPFGHKKSGKHSVDTSGNTIGQHVPAMSIPAMSVHQNSNLCTYSHKKSEPSEDNIQSSHISSCTDIGNILNTEVVNKHKPIDIIHDDYQHQGNNNDGQHDETGTQKQETVYESPTSSAYVSSDKTNDLPVRVSTSRKSTPILGVDFLDVETLTDDSDVDVVGESFTPAASRQEHEDSYKDEIDVTGVSDSESVVEYVGEEGHRRITIGSDSSDESDDNSYIEVLHHDSDQFVDVLGNSDDDSLDSELDYIDVTDNQPGNKVIIQSDSDDTELDYSGDVELDMNDNAGSIQHNTDIDLNKQNTQETNKAEMSTLPPETVQHPGSSSVLSNETSIIASVPNLNTEQSIPVNEDEEVCSGNGESCELDEKLDTVENELSVSTDTCKESENRDSKSDKTTNDIETLISDDKKDKSDTIDSLKEKHGESDRNMVQEEVSDSDRYDASLEQSGSTSESRIKDTINECTRNVSTSPTLTTVEPAVSIPSVSFGSSGLSWTASPLFQPRDQSLLMDTGHTFTGLEPHSPLFQSSPEYEQLYPRSPSFDEFSPAVSETSEENFVPED